MKRAYNNRKPIVEIIVGLIARWAFLCGIIFVIICLIDIISSAMGNKASGTPLAFRLIFAAIGSFIANLILHFFISPRLNNTFSRYRRLLMQIADEGYSDETISAMEEQLEICQKDREKNLPLITHYALFLSEAYLSLHRYREAEEKLKLVDMEYMANQAKITNDKGAHQNIITLHVLWIQLYSAMNDIEMTEHWVRCGENFFSQFRGNNRITDYFIDTAYFESLLVHRQYENALKLLEKYSGDEQPAFGVELDKGRCYKRIGLLSEAAAAFDAAYGLAVNDWRKTMVDFERNTLPKDTAN